MEQTFSRSFSMPKVLFTQRSFIPSVRCHFKINRDVSAFLSLVWLSCLTWLYLLSSSAFANPKIENCRKVIFEAPETAESVCLPLLMPEHEDPVSKNEQTKIYIDMASLYSINGEFDKATQFLDEAIRQNPILEEVNLYRYNWLRMRGTVRFRQGDLQAALPFMQEALSIAKIVDRDSVTATSLNDVGAIQMRLGNYQQALITFLQALDILETIDRPFSTSLTLANIGIIYRDLQDFDQAISYFERGKNRLFSMLQDSPEDTHLIREYAYSMEELGNTYMLQGKLNLAKQNLDNAIALFEQHQFFIEHSRVLVAQARLASIHNRHQQALQLIEQAETVLQQIEPAPESGFELLLEKAKVLTALQDDQSAIEVIEQTKRREADEPILTLRLELLQLGAQLYRRNDSPERALEYLNDYTRVYKAYLEEKYQPETSNLLSLIEVQQQSREIETLKQVRDMDLLKMEYQRWTIIVGIVVIALLLFFIAVIYRQKQQIRQSLNRELKFHASELERLGQQESEVSEQDDIGEKTESLMSLLVELMNDCIDVWEIATGEDRIELAQKSKIWKVTIDDGRLRTRTMDRYTDIAKIPNAPRWRQVVRTCHYILGNCNLNQEQRDRLNQSLENFVAARKTSDFQTASS